MKEKDDKLKKLMKKLSVNSKKVIVDKLNECYKYGGECKYNCDGLCKESC